MRGQHGERAAGPAAPRRRQVAPPRRREAVEHRADELHERRLAGLVGTEEDVQPARHLAQLQAAPDAEAVDFQCRDSHAWGSSPLNKSTPSKAASRSTRSRTAGSVTAASCRGLVRGGTGNASGSRRGTGKARGARGVRLAQEVFQIQPLGRVHLILPHGPQEIAADRLLLVPLGVQHGPRLDRQRRAPGRRRALANSFRNRPSTSAASRPPQLAQQRP